MAVNSDGVNRYVAVLGAVVSDSDNAQCFVTVMGASDTGQCWVAVT